MIKKECSTCDSWHRDQFCMRVASGIACVVGLVQRIRPEDIPVAGLGKKARDTQVAGDHYKTVAVQPWDVVDTWPLEQRIGYYRGGALKYVMRMGGQGRERTGDRQGQALPGETVGGSE